MKGTIKAAKGAVCSKCSQKDCFRNSFNDIVGYSIPTCSHCGGVPTKVKAVTVKPGTDGKARPFDIYRDSKEKPLTTIADAIAVLGQMNKEIESGTYRAEKHDPKTKENYKFSDFAEEYLNDFRERSKLPKEHDDFITPGGLRNKANSVKVLKTYFKDTSIFDIDKHTINIFYRSFVDKWQTRNLAVGELKTILRYAHLERDILPSVPPFPKIQKARSKRADEIPTVELQAEIIFNIKNEKYRDMWTLAASLAKRPCEIRAYQVQDINPRNGTITTARHISKGEAGVGDQVVAGRKSIKESEELGIVVDPIDEFLVSMLAKYTKGKVLNDFIFPGHYKAFVSEDALNDAWRKSCRLLGVRVKPYEGTKHATLTELLRTSGDYAQTKNFSNHTNIITLQRYAKTRAEDKRELLDTTRFRKV